MASVSPIQIVPLRMDAAAPATRPKLSYRGGSLLSSVQVFVFFWGDAWQGARRALVQQLNGFFDDMLTSPLIDQMAEYSVPGQAIGHGKRTRQITVPTAHAAESVSDADIQHMIQQEIATDPALPQPTGNTLYFVYLPPGVGRRSRAEPSCHGLLRLSQRHQQPGLLRRHAVSPAARAAPAGSRCSTP